MTFYNIKKKIFNIKKYDYIIYTVPLRVTVSHINMYRDRRNSIL